MDLRRAVKKIAALGAGTVMMGATMLGALAAADLANYPAPFVVDGKFDGFIVVGDKAAAEDVVGAVDIGASLQFELKKEVSVAVAAEPSVVVTEGVKIVGTGGEVLNYNEDLGDVRVTPLDDADLPVMLAEGRYIESEGATDNDVTYTQLLSLGSENGRPLHDQPTDGLNMADYLELYDDALLYNYTLEFDDNVEYALTGTGSLADDIEGSTIEIQGNVYTITDVKFASDLTIDEITLMAGVTLVWLQQDQVITKTIAGVPHEIKVIDVTDDEDSCGVSVDGEVAWIDVKSSKVISGVNIGVLDAKAVHAQLQDVDICEINVGAQELKLKNGDRLEKDNVEVKDANVVITNAGNGTWTGFRIEFTPDDDTFLAKDQSFTDPALENFKFVMGGVLTPREEIKVATRGSRDAKITFVNNDGKKVEVPIQVEPSSTVNTNVTWGSDVDEPLLFEGNVFDCGASVEDCDGVLLFAVTSGGTAHVLEITDVDATEDTVDLRDLTYGRTFDDKSYSAPISLGSLGSITLDFNETDGSITATDLTAYIGGAGNTESNFGALINLSAPDLGAGPDIVASNNTPATILTVTEDDIDDPDISAAVIPIRIRYDNGSDARLEVDLEGNTFSGAVAAFGTNDKIEDVSDIQVIESAHGSIVELDIEDYKYVSIAYPKKEVEVNVFISPVSAQIAPAAAEVKTITLERLNVGAARLASEIADATRDNLIIVGGPCANQVAATVMGLPYAVEGCDAGFEEGKAIIRLYDQPTGKVSMVVAGMTALDTRRATRVVANYKAYKDVLKGSSVVVSGTTLADIKVSPPA